MIKIIVLILCLLLSSPALATVFVNENWDTGTPAACWPCKTSSCPNTFNNWISIGPAEIGGSGAVPNSGLTTEQAHSGTRSYKMTKQVGTTDSCGLQYHFTNTSTVHFRFYVWLGSDFTNWQVSGQQNSHWIFMVETAFSCTGFRLDMLGSGGDVFGSCPSGQVCMQPSGEGCSLWGDEYHNYSSCAGGGKWPVPPNWENLVGKWTALEYKLEILSSSACSAAGMGSNCVRMTEWIDGVQTRGPCTGIGHNASTFSWIIFTFYEHAASSKEMAWYIDDIVIADSYIGLSGEPGDTTAPTVTSASVASNGTTVTVNFSETVVTTGYDNGDFDLDCTTAGSGIALNSISGSGSSRTFTAASTIGIGDTCNLDYTGGVNEIEDAAGNDLAVFSNTSVTNSSTQDLTVPVVTAFTITPTTYASWTIPIATFTATDNVGVTGYCLTATSAPPTSGVCTGSGWSATAQTSYTFTSDGNKQLWAWAKDATGNISTNIMSDTILIDTTAPWVSSVTSNTSNGAYITGQIIDIQVTFSEVVTSTGNVTVTLETGSIDRTCTFTISGNTLGTCNYTVQVGDYSIDLNVNSVSGVIADALGNLLVNTVPVINLASNKALLVNYIVPIGGVGISIR